MTKFNEYREPEFKVVRTNLTDILTASEGSNTLGTANNAWDTLSSQNGSNVGGISFNL